MKKFLTMTLASAMSLGVSFGPAAHTVFAQATSTNGGSIQGTITDPSGAVVGKATIQIKGTDTGFSDEVNTSDSAGFYSVGPLNPGNYQVTVAGPGFQKLVVTTVVRTGTATSGNFKLVLGASSETVEVTAGEPSRSTPSRPASPTCLPPSRSSPSPSTGATSSTSPRSIPGVILQSGESFDPTKAGYSAISVGGVSGRTTRILLDGQDITDETVGTTIFNVSQGAISEFQLNRSTQDVSGDVTSTGQVLVATTSGTNQLPRSGLLQLPGLPRALRQRPGPESALPAQPVRRQHRRSDLKDKLFFFANAERIKQDSSSPVTVGSLFPSSRTSLSELPTARPTPPPASTTTAPSAATTSCAPTITSTPSTAPSATVFQRYANRDNTPGIAGGADLQKGRFTHSFRVSYEKFHNLISDASSGGLLNLLPGITFENVAQNLYTGPNDLAPQGTFQSDKQFRYDGTWTKGRPSFKYGYSLNRIQGGGFAAFFGIGPRVRETSGTSACWW